MSKAEQKRYWEENLDPHNLGGGARGVNYARELPFYLTPDQVYALEHLGDLRGRALLEIGAGIGMNALHMARRGAKVFAIDIAQERLKALMQAAPQSPDSGSIYPVKCSAEALPFRSGKFDGACSNS